MPQPYFDNVGSNWGPAPGLAQKFALDAQQGAQGWKTFQDTMDEISSRAVKAKSLRAALKAYDPDGKDKYDSMGLADLEGTIQGKAMQMNQQQQQATINAETARAEQLRASTGLIGPQIQEALARVNQAKTSIDMENQQMAQMREAALRRAGDASVIRNYFAQASGVPADAWETVKQYGGNPDAMPQMMRPDIAAAVRNFKNNPNATMMLATQGVPNFNPEVLRDIASEQRASRQAQLVEQDGNQAWVDVSGKVHPLPAGKQLVPVQDWMVNSDNATFTKKLASYTDQDEVNQILNIRQKTHNATYESVMDKIMLGALTGGVGAGMPTDSNDPGGLHGYLPKR